MQDLAKIQSCSIHSPPCLRTGLPRKSIFRIFRIVIFSKIFAKQDKDLLRTLMLSIARLQLMLPFPPDISCFQVTQ